MLIAATAAAMTMTMTSTMTSTTSAHLSVTGFLGFRAGDLPRVAGPGEVDVPTGEEGSVIRFDAEPGDDLMSRWVVLEPGHRYRVEPSNCAGVRFLDLGQAKDARRPFVQVDASKLGETVKFPLRVFTREAKELDAITWADVGHTHEAQLDPACPDSGARVWVKDSAGKTLFDQWIVIPHERVTRVTLQPGGGFTTTAFDASAIYFREEAQRVDAVELGGVRIVGQPYGVRHTHGEEGAKVDRAIFTVKNTNKFPRTLSAKKVELVREYGRSEATLLGVALAIVNDVSPYAVAGTPAPSVFIGPGETAVVQVHVKTMDVYLASILSSFRWSVDFEVGGKTVTATVPLGVMRMEPYRPRDGEE